MENKAQEGNFLLISVKQEIINSINKSIESLRSGTPVLIIDNEIEGEGDICAAAQTVTAEIVNFMVSACRGIVCQPIVHEMSTRLNLPLMVPQGGSPSFTITADAIGVGSGTSAHDRAFTARTIANLDTAAKDLVRPGHIFPILARQGGVLERAGHTEASTDLVTLAGFTQSSLICEVMEDNGHMARSESLIKFAHKYGLPVLTVRDLIDFRSAVGDDFTTAKQVLMDLKLEISPKGNGKNSH